MGPKADPDSGVEETVRRIEKPQEEPGLKQRLDGWIREIHREAVSFTPRTVEHSSYSS
jgi:hypothetical protein